MKHKILTLMTLIFLNCSANENMNTTNKPNTITNHKRGTASYCDSCNVDEDCLENMICQPWQDLDGNRLSTWCTDNYICLVDSDCHHDYICRDKLCTPKIYQDCHEGDIWYFDSCSVPLMVAYTCTNDYVCNNPHGIQPECSPGENTPCEDDCDYEGQKECVNSENQRYAPNRYNICGNFDDDPCLDWAYYECSYGLCNNGECE